MYRATIENRGDTRSFATTRHARFVFDTAGNGANAIDTLLACLCSCMGHYVRDFLLDQGVGSSGFTIAAEAGVVKDTGSLGEIQVRIDLGGVQLDAGQSARLLTFVENCKVYKILKGNPGVRVAVLPVDGAGERL